jgi:ABC-type Fe3+-hydroxamate transport system substrate-binding protein
MFVHERVFLKTLMIFVLSVFVFCISVLLLSESKGEATSSSAPVSLTSAFGTAHTKGRVITVSQQPLTDDMRIVRVHVPPFYSTHSALTSWGAGFNKVQLI